MTKHLAPNWQAMARFIGAIQKDRGTAPVIIDRSLLGFRLTRAWGGTFISIEFVPRSIEWPQR